MHVSIFANVRTVAVGVSLLVLVGCHDASSMRGESESTIERLAPVNSLAMTAPVVAPVHQPALDQSDLTQKSDVGVPIAAFEETDHSFGEMDPYTFGKHSFRVTNEGTAPLVLKLGESSCNCTVSQVQKKPILPGDSAEVLIRWQTSKNNKYFSESSSIRTNDPTRSDVELRVRGHVRVHFGASPPRFEFSRIRPGENASLTSLLSSQVWPSFVIEDVRSSMPGIKWEVSEPPAIALDDIKAKSGKHLTVTVPNYLKQGSFTHWLRVKIRPDGEDEATEYELPLVGKVVRRLAVYGKNIDQTGTIRLGVISSHVGLTQRYLVKVRDKQSALLVRDIKTTPECLDVQLHTKDASIGLYEMEINIPEGTKPCDYISQSTGNIQIDFEHPRIDSLELKMVFAVADRPPTR